MEQKQQNGMNQRQIAEALGLSRTAIQKLEVRAMKKFLDLLAQKNIKREDFF